MVRGALWRLRRSLAQLSEPPFVVPFRPEPNLIAPLVCGQRNAAPLVDAPVGFVLRGFAVDDDAVEVEDDGCRRGHTTILTAENAEPIFLCDLYDLRGFLYSALSAIIGSTPVARRAGM